MYGNQYDKLLLYNQYNIMQNMTQDPEETQNYKNMQRLLSRNQCVDSISVLLSHKSQDVSEVIDILTLCERLQKLFVITLRDPAIDFELIKFKGFDQRSESVQLQIAQTIIEELEDFYYLRLVNYEAREPMLPVYRAMLKVYNETKNIIDLKLYTEKVNKLINNNLDT